MHHLLYNSGNKKKCAGRNKKRLGDLCLLANLSYDALSHYAAAVDGLRSANDLLWLAGALEGICAATIICKSNCHISYKLITINIDYSVQRYTSIRTVVL